MTHFNITCVNKLTRNTNAILLGFTVLDLDFTSDETTAYLGGCGDGSISSEVEAPLSKPHHGLITPVFGLCNILVYLLQKVKTRVKFNNKDYQYERLIMGRTFIKTWRPL